MKYLPRKPSRLIRLALKDLAAREKDPRYIISMGGWHSPVTYPDKACRVCLAGAVMARFGITHTKDRCPADFPAKIRDKFYALNEFRVGSIDTGLEYLGIDHPAALPRNVGVYPYSFGPEQFRHDMNVLADRLESVGL